MVEPISIDKLKEEREVANSTHITVIEQNMEQYVKYINKRIRKAYIANENNFVFTIRHLSFFEKALLKGDYKKYFNTVIDKMSEYYGDHGYETEVHTYSKPYCSGYSILVIKWRG